MKQVILLCCVVICLVSCSKRVDNRKEKLIGTWKSTDVLFNGGDCVGCEEMFEVSLDEDSMVVINHDASDGTFIGAWDLDDRGKTLLLSHRFPKDDSQSDSIQVKEWKIKRLTEQKWITERTIKGNTWEISFEKQ